MKKIFRSFLVILFILGLTVFHAAASPFDEESLVIPPRSNSSTDQSSFGTSPEEQSNLPPAPSAKPKISGAFLQLAEGHNDESQYPLDYWMKELQFMKDIGLDTLIIQFNQSNGVNFSEATERILEAADKIHLKVFIGTALNESTWWYTVNKFNPKWLEKESKIIADYTRVLVRQFSPHPSFYGVYIPNEDNTLGFPVSVGKFYGRIVDAVREENDQLKTMISPFTTLQPGRAISFPKKVLELYFKTMLKYAHVDICAWQDGVGGTREQLNRVSHDLGAIVKACEELKIDVWANIEVFHRTTPLNQEFSAEATDIETMKQQLSIEYPYVSKVICFDFNHYLSPSSSIAKAPHLYEAYKEYLLEP